MGLSQAGKGHGCKQEPENMGTSRRSCEVDRRPQLKLPDQNMAKADTHTPSNFQPDTSSRHHHQPSIFQQNIFPVFLHAHFEQNISADSIKETLGLHIPLPLMQLITN